MFIQCSHFDRKSPVAHHTLTHTRILSVTLSRYIIVWVYFQFFFIFVSSFFPEFSAFSCIAPVYQTAKGNRKNIHQKKSTSRIQYFVFAYIFFFSENSLVRMSDRVFAAHIKRLGQWNKTKREFRKCWHSVCDLKMTKKIWWQIVHFSWRTFCCDFISFFSKKLKSDVIDVDDVLIFVRVEFLISVILKIKGNYQFFGVVFMGKKVANKKIYIFDTHVMPCNWKRELSDPHIVKPEK